MNSTSTNNSLHLRNHMFIIRFTSWNVSQSGEENVSSAVASAAPEVNVEEEKHIK